MYKSGLYFSEIVAVNIQDGLHRVKIGKATCFIIDGGVGEGKTTLGVHLADYINKVNGLPEISLELNDHPQIAMGGKEFSKQMRQCYLKRLPVILYDEAGDYARRQAMTTFNAFLNRIFETYRAFKIVVIICLPNQYVLDNTLFDNKIPRLLLHCEGRTERQGNFKGYSLKRMFFIRGLMRKLEDKNYSYKVNEPCFYGHFLDLPKDRAKKLDALTIKGKMEVLKETEAHLGNLLSMAEVSSKTGYNPNTLRQKFKQLGIKPVTKIGKNVYYNKDILQSVKMKQYEVKHD